MWKNKAFKRKCKNMVELQISFESLLPDFVAREQMWEGEEMNLYMEKDITPKAIPTIVPLAYQAIGMLNQKINEVQMTAYTFSKEQKAKEESVPLWKRYALSISEAAKYFGIGEKRLYQIIAEHEGEDFILEIGSHIKIKRELFGRFLDKATCV